MDTFGTIKTNLREAEDEVGIKVDGGKETCVFLPRNAKFLKKFLGCHFGKEEAILREGSFPPSF